MKGWISIHRELQDNWLWKDKPFSFGQAWIDLLLLANHEDTKIPYKGEIIVCEKGTVNRSISSLANRWGWSRDKARRFLTLLVDDEMCVVKATTNRTTITIVNYSKFQDMVATNNATNNATNRQRVMQRADTNNNDNNENNKEIVTKVTTKKVFEKPTVEEVRAYCRERNNGINADSFVDFYESKGWLIGKNKMKDWKAAVRTWERSRKNNERDTYTESFTTFQIGPDD